MSKAAKRETKIGATQAEVLETLALRRGEWHAGCGWHWDGTAGTTRIMDSLARRSLVEKRPPTHKHGSTTYSLTALGAKSLLTMRPNLRGKLVLYPYASPILKAEAQANV